MATFKQYLQNRWYRGMSQDRTVAYPYQFQYGKNVNVRNEKWAVMLSSRPYIYDMSESYENIIQLAPWPNGVMYALELDEDNNQCVLKQWDMSPQTEQQLSTLATLQTWDTSWLDVVPFWPYIKQFRDWIFIVNWANTKTYYIQSWWWQTYAWILAEQVIANLWLLDNITYATDMKTHAVYNFADTFFLISVWWVLLRFQPLTNDITDMWNRKIIRYFWAGKTIVWLSQSWNYLKIYVTDGQKTRCHYAQWTFDLEESWMVQTITYEWVLIEDCLQTNWTTDYWLFRDSIWIKLVEMDWYTTNTIRQTEKRLCEYSVEWGSPAKTTEYIFYDTAYNYWWSGAKLVWYDNVLYCSLPEEWIWTFTKESVWSHWWCWWWVIEWGMSAFTNTSVIGDNAPLWKIQQMCIQNWIMYTLLLNPYAQFGTNQYIALCKIFIADRPESFVNDWFIIWNVFDWWCWSLFKKNVSTTLVCWNAVPRITNNGLIWLFYRYDRANSSLCYPIFYGTNFIKFIETSWIYDSVFITSVQNDISWFPRSEVATPEKFNRPRNTLEYIVYLSQPQDENWNFITWSSTPILYEHNLIYEDSMRKYR